MRQRDFLPNQLLHLGGFTHAAARRRHERPHAYIDAEAALDYGRDCAHHNLLVGEGLLQRRPVSGLGNLLAG